MNKIVIFVLGAATGSLVTWKIVENKYKKLADEEIESVREYYKNKDAKEHLVECEVYEEFVEPKVTVTEYKDKINELGYTIVEEETIEDPYEVKVEPGPEMVTPYIIAPEEFGETYGFTTKSWTYYSDNVLVDELGNIVFEPESIIGDGLEHFGEYEDDSVYVRNENTECDYEILKHEKTFEEINEEDS